MKQLMKKVGAIIVHMIYFECCWKFPLPPYKEHEHQNTVFISLASSSIEMIWMDLGGHMHIQLGYMIGNLSLGAQIFYNRQWAFLHLLCKETLYLPMQKLHIQENGNQCFTYKTHRHARDSWKVSPNRMKNTLLFKNN